MASMGVEAIAVIKKNSKKYVTVQSQAKFHKTVLKMLAFLRLFLKLYLPLNGYIFLLFA